MPPRAEPFAPSWVAACAAPGGEGKLRVAAERGAPPVLVETERCVVLLSGWLDRPGESAQGDLDFALEAYLRGGEDGLGALRGTFALVLHDLARGCLVAMRDPLGYHPLFFAARAGGALIGASQDDLLGEGVSKEIDCAAVAGWICDRSLGAEDTFFGRIKRVLPGHLLRVAHGGVEQRRYWAPSTGRRSGATDFARAHREFDELLRRSVARSLRFGPAAIWLSGGIDSTAVAAVAADISREAGLPDPVALSLKFPDSASDEADRQRTVAKALGLPHVLVSFADAFGPDGGVVGSLRTAPDLPGPPGKPWSSAYDHLAGIAVGRGCGVILNGDWGEWFQATEEHAADLLARLDLRGLRRLVEADRRYYGMSGGTAARRILWKYGARHLLRQTAAATAVRLGAGEALGRRRRQSLLDWIPEWVAPDTAVREEVAARWAATLPRPAFRRFHERALRAALDAPESATWMDHSREFASRFGIEVGEPFHDPELLEFLFQLSPDLLFFRADPKALLWESVRLRLPRLPRAAIGLAWPDRAFESLLVEEGTRALARLGGLPMLAERGIVATEKPTAALATGDFGVGGPQATWRTLAAEAWLQSRL